MFEVRNNSVCVAGFSRDAVLTVKTWIAGLLPDSLAIESFHVKIADDVKDGALLVPKVILVATHRPGQKLLDHTSKNGGQLDLLYDEVCQTGGKHNFTGYWPRRHDIYIYIYIYMYCHTGMGSSSGGAADRGSCMPPCPGLAPRLPPSYLIIPVNLSALDICLRSAPHARPLCPSRKTGPTHAHWCIGKKFTVRMHTKVDYFLIVLITSESALRCI